MWRVNGHNKHAVTTLQNIQIIGLVWEEGLLRTKNMTSYKVTVFSVRFLFEARKGTIVRLQSAYFSKSPIQKV